MAYFPYVEPTADADKGLLAALASRACVVVTDEFPCFFLPHGCGGGNPIAGAGGASGLERAVAATGGNASFSTALAFRPFLQKNLKPHLARMPVANPLADAAVASARESAGRNHRTLAGIVT